MKSESDCGCTPEATGNPNTSVPVAEAKKRSAPSGFAWRTQKCPEPVGPRSPRPLPTKVDFEYAFTNEPKPPDDWEMNYWKTRSERILQRATHLQAGLTTLNHLVDDDAMMRGEGVDPRLGTLFIKIAAVNPELAVRITVYWQLPGGWAAYEYASLALTVNQVNEVRLWDGPIPGPVRFELEFTNNGTPITATVTADIVAKRDGSRFDTGMRIHFADPEPDLPVAPPLFAPDPKRDASRSRRPTVPCGVPTLYRVSAPREGEQEARSHDGEWDRGAVCGDQGASDPIPDPELVAVLNMLDEERSFSGDEPILEVTDEGRVGVSMRRMEIRLPAAMGGQRDGSFSFPAPELQGNPFWTGPLENYVGRCDGFEDRWREVSFGLEEDRVPRAYLRLILPPTIVDSGAEAVPGGRKWVPMREMLDDDGPLDSEWTWSHEHGERSDSAAYPWLDQRRYPTWYMISLLDLVSKTLRDALPRRIETPFGRRKVTKRASNVVRRVFGAEEVEERRVHKAYRRQAAWKLSGDLPPFVRIKGGLVAKAMENMPSFRLYRMGWTAGVGTLNWNGWEPLLPNVPGLTGSPAPFLNPIPIPTTIHLRSFAWVPYAEGARKLYAAARLYTMFASTYAARQQPELADGMQAAATKLYRAFLTCLLIPGKLLVHELFHTTNWVARKLGWTPMQRRARWLRRRITQYRQTMHCPSGCAQEKMAIAWVNHVARQYAPPPLERSRQFDAVVNEPPAPGEFFRTSYNDGGTQVENPPLVGEADLSKYADDGFLTAVDKWESQGDWSEMGPDAAFASTCMQYPEVAAVTRYSRWPIDPGDRLRGRPSADYSGSAAAEARFKWRCWWSD